MGQDSAEILDGSGIDGGPSGVVTFRFSDPTLDFPAEMLEPVVRVFGTYRNQTEQGTLPVGSGFFLNGWSQQLITAAHVVAPPVGAWLDELSIEIRWRGGKQWVQACSVAYPREWERADAAVICLGKAISGTSPFWSLATVEEPGVFSATLRGYSESGAFRVEPVRAALSDVYLKYLSGSGRPAMSGGPLEFDGYVVGVHKGNIPINGVKRACATALSPELLSELQDQAVEKCGEPS